MTERTEHPPHRNWLAVRRMIMSDARLTTAAALALAVLLSLPASLGAAAEAAADWPQWRGPNRDGVPSQETALIAALPAALSVKWEYALPPTAPKRPYYSSPVVAGGRAYLRVTPSSEDGKTVEDLVVCVGLDDGREVWTFRQPGGGAKYGAPNMPCVASGRLYFVGSQGTVFCLDAATGRELWRTPLDIKGESYSSSVAVVDGKVVVADTQLLALDAGTGAKVWANPAIKAHHNSPAVWRHGGKTYLLAGHGNPKDKTTWKTCCVDLAGGKELWQAAGGCYASPVVSGDYLAMLYWETGLKVYQMTPAAATDLGGAALASDDNQSCTAAVKDGKVYGFAAKEAFCYDIGKKDFAWRIPVSAKSGSPVITDGKVLQAASKTLRMFEAATGKDLGPAKGVNVGIVGHSSPALADGKLLVNAGTHLRCYDLAKH